MAPTLTRDDLIKHGSVQVDGFRVRLVESKDVPLLNAVESLVGKKVVLFDLPEAGDIEKESLEPSLQMLPATPDETLKSDVDEQDPEVPSADGEMPAQERHYAVWTLSTLEKMAGMKETFEELASAARDEDKPTFDLHLCACKDVFDYDYSTVSENQELFEGLAEGGYFFVADANDPLRMVLRGHVKLDDRFTNFIARSFGTLKDSMKKLNGMSMDLGTSGQLIGLKCRSRYDVLPPAMAHTTYNDLIPAHFYVDSEWSVSVPKEQPRRPREPKPFHIPDFFSKPNPQSVAKITFRPGWLDPRLHNHTRSLELKFLLTLCDFLENGECVWPETQEQPEVVERVMTLIKEERDPIPGGDHDFTERLWDELRLCRSHATASKAFDLIFDEIRTGTFRAAVRPDNKSSLSWMLRSHGHATEMERCREPLYCAHLLVELGLDRLKRDLYKDFIERELLHTTADLDEMLQNAHQIEARVQALLVMHLAQQSLITIRELMGYERSDLSRLGSRLLAHFNVAPPAEKFRAEFTFEAPIRFFTLDALRATNVQEWSVERTWAGNDGEIPGSEVDLIFLSVRPLLEHIAPYRTKSKKADDAQARAANDTARSRIGSVSEKPDPTAYHCIHLLADSTLLGAF